MTAVADLRELAIRQVSEWASRSKGGYPLGTNFHSCPTTFIADASTKLTVSMN
jgi:hypothetical protein